MSNNFNKDSLEDFFKTGLQEDLTHGMESDGWDMPSDQVWDRIEEGITIRRLGGDNSRTWLSIAATFLLLVLSYQTVTYQQNNSDLQEQMTALSDKVEQINDFRGTTTNQSDTYQNSIVKTYNNSFSEKEIAFAELSNTTNSRSKNELFAASNGHKTMNGQHTTQLNSGNYTNTPSSIPYFSITAPVEQHAVMTTASASNNIAVPSARPALNISNKQWLAFDNTAEDLEAKGTPQMIEPLHKKQAQNGWYANAYFGPSLVSKKMKGYGTEEMKKLEREGKTDRAAFQTGVKIGYQLSDKWSVEGGVAYTKSQTSRSHDLRLQYNPELVTMTHEGKFDIPFASELHTAYGNIPVNINLAHGTDPELEEGAIIAFKLDSEQELHMLQVPVAVNYTIGEGPLKLRLSAGATANFLAQSKINVSSSISELTGSGHEGLTYESSSLKNGHQIPDLNKVTCSLTAGAALDYALTDQLHVYVAPTVEKGITPIYENEEVEVELMQANVLLGVSYFF